MEELKPCPFCGNIPELLEYGESSITVACICGWNCGDWHISEEEDCIMSWNTRQEENNEMS